MNWTALLLGAALGQLLPLSIWSIRKLYRYRCRRLAQRTLRAAANTYKNSRWIIEYYTQHRELDSLFDCRIDGYDTKIPFISLPGWSCFGDEDLTAVRSALFDVVEGDAQFPIDDKAIALRRRLGQRIWEDSPSVYLDRVDWSESNLPTFVLKGCTFHQILTNLIKIEDETIRNVRSRRSMRAPIRSEVIPDATTALRLQTKPFGLGCAVALLLKSPDDLKLLVHQRSDILPVYPGAKALVPNFGFEPVRRLDTNATDENILRYNFLKEYLEELFDYEELITESLGRRVNPLWFYDCSDEARNLRDAIEKNQFTLTYLGFGFDCLNAVPIVGFAAVIESDRVITDIVTKTKSNWEGVKIHIVSVRKERRRLREWLKNGSYHPGAAFALARTLQLVEERDLLQQGPGASAAADRQ